MEPNRIKTQLPHIAGTPLEVSTSASRLSGVAAPLPTATETPFAVGTAKIAKRYDASTRTIQNWRNEGMPFLLVSSRKVLFVVAETDEWVRTKFSVGRPKPTLKRIAASQGGSSTPAA